MAIAATGLLIPPAATYALSFYGITLPVAIPALASLVAAALLFFAPDHEIRGKADQARSEMVHALSAYIDLIALTPTTRRRRRAATSSASRRSAHECPTPRPG